MLTWRCERPRSRILRFCTSQGVQKRLKREASPFSRAAEDCVPFPLRIKVHEKTETPPITTVSEKQRLFEHGPDMGTALRTRVSDARAMPSSRLPTLPSFVALSRSVLEYSSAVLSGVSVPVGVGRQCMSSVSSSSQQNLALYIVLCLAILYLLYFASHAIIITRCSHLHRSRPQLETGQQLHLHLCL